MPTHEQYKEHLEDVLKKHNLMKVKARVVLVLDTSISMKELYKKETIQNVVNKIFPIATTFNSNEQLDCYIFSLNYSFLPSIKKTDVSAYVLTRILLKFNGKYYNFLEEHMNFCFKHLIKLKNELDQKEKDSFFKIAKETTTEIEDLKRDIDLYEKVCKPNYFQVNESMKIFDENNESGVMRDIVKRYSPQKPSNIIKQYIIKKHPIVPTYIVFITGGEIKPESNTEIQRIITESSDKPLFWQFIGLRKANYGVLEKLDKLTNCYINNASFLVTENIKEVSDEELYKALLGEFLKWVDKATEKGVLKHKGR